jgi:hypothetical protein
LDRQRATTIDAFGHVVMNDVRGADFTLEARIVYALVKRLGGNVRLTLEELNIDDDTQGLLIDNLKNTAFIDVSAT